MKATMKTEDLRDALKKVHPIKINRQLPSLSSTLAEFSDGKATLTTSDLERIIKVELDSKSDEPFSVMLPLKTTEKFLHGANGDMTLETGKSPKNITLKRDMGEFTLETPPISDFPPAKIADDVTWSKLDAKWFCRMLGIMVEACATEISRPILTGIHCKDGAMASADGFRLIALKDNKLSFGLADGEVIIPNTTANLARRLFAKEDIVEIAFEISDASFNLAKEVQRVYFKSNNVLMVSQVIQGTFPQYEQLIPQEYTCKVSFSAPVMAQRLGMMDEETLPSGIVRFVFQQNDKTKEHECLLSAGNDDYGKYSLVVPVKIESGNGSRIAFNIKYIQALLKHFSITTLELNSASSPGKFIGDVEGLTVVVMPMFVQW